MTTWTNETALDYLYDNSLRSETGCLEWQGSRNTGGYGQLTSRSLHEEYGIKGTHRLMVHLTTGHLFTGRHEQVLHSCDNPCCIEPRHLRVGTARENQQDCVAKGRKATTRNYKHPKVYLIEDQVRIMKAMLRAGIKNADIARLFDIPAGTVSGIKNGHRWSHID